MNIKPIMTLFTMLIVLLGSQVASADDYMSADSVKALVSGKTFDGIHLKKDYTYRAYAAPDGQVTQVKSNGDRKTGKWSVLPNGKQCIEWDNTDIRKCFHIRDNGDGSYTKVKLKGDKVIPLLRWSNFTDGNGL